MLTRASMQNAALLFLCGFFAVGCGAPPPTPGDDAGVDGGTHVGDGGLDLNDVSWLVPLPTASTLDAMLPLDAAGPKGALLPRALYDALPGLVEQEPADLLYAKYRVVSARVDPCFPASASGGCVRQLRLVAQPVVVDAQFQFTTEDGAIHLLYALDDAGWAEVLTAVKQLKTLAGAETDGQPLDVHPVMKREGLRGAYATALHAMVTRQCGQQNLVRVAFMKLVQKDVAWRFGALNLVGGQLVNDSIPRLGSLTEQGVQEFGTTAFRSGQLQPDAPGDQFSVLLSENELRLTDQRTYDRAIASALSLESPAKSNPKTVDCGSCHTASRSLRNAMKERPFDASQFAERYVGNSRFNLSRIDAAGDDPRALRAFGYFGTQSALSQRTINESAEVALSL